MEELWNLMIHADESIGELVAQYGKLTYLILFAIIFVETGLVVVAFFPGDGLLISAGILAAGGDLALSWLLLLLSAATILGHTSNYLIARWIGRRFLDQTQLGQQAYLQQAESYYQKYGGAAVVFSRFFPFFRTLVPFVSGMAKMNGVLFTWCNTLGGFLWVSVYVLLGYFFGEIPWVKANYGLVLSILLLLLICALLLALIKGIIKGRTRERK